MRNLKRALSLVLAMVMLLGMMMIPTNAEGYFADADLIENTEAVAITAGMGLFAGSDGKFDPQGTVTRAQMATIIVKMIYGSDFNADAFKGAANPFTDTASFEGGWAEGYINACFQMGVVKGYGDGTFKPGNSVTTAEAVTMIINALKVDAGQGEWPLTVMAKASEMKLFGDLNPAPSTNTALIRDQLAVIVLEGLQYSPKGASGYKVDGVSFVFDDMADALKAAGYDISKISEVVGEDTLANSVYSMGVANGFVVGNKATGEEYTVVGTEDFNVETGLDLIGHYVSVYYQMPEQGKTVEAYEVYAVIDESTVVIAAEDLDSAKEYKAAFGKNYDMVAMDQILVFDGEYNIVAPEAGNVPYIPGQSAPKGTYIIYENKVVAFLRPGVSYASKIVAITDFDGEKTYTLAGVPNPLDAEEITLYLGAAKGDYVTYTLAGGQYVLSPADPVKGTVSRTSTNKDGDTVLTVGGQQYVLFNAERNAAGLDNDISTLTYGTEQYKFYVSQDNEVVGWEAADGSSSSEVNIDDVVYALGTFSLESNGGYGMKVRKHYLQGVNTQGEEAHVLLAVEYDEDGGDVFVTTDPADTLGTVPVASDYPEGFYVLADIDSSAPNAKDAKKEGVKTAARVGLQSEGGDLFYGTNRWATTATSGITYPGSESNNHICTSACTAMGGGSSNHATADANTKRTFFISSTKFLIVDGVLGEALETDVGGDGFSYTVPSGETFAHPFLYSINDVGAIQIEMVVLKKDPDELTASTSPIYVADADKDGSSADGDMYEVYDAATGKVMELIMESAPTVGFWRYIVDDDGIASLTTAVTSATNVAKDVYFAGLFNGKTASVKNAAGETIDPPTGADAIDAKVVDLRTQAVKDASGISTITTVEQMANLLDVSTVIAMDVWCKSESTVGTFYIKDVIVNPTGVIYVPSSSTAHTYNTVYTTAGDVDDIYLTVDSSVTGFAEVKPDKGDITLEAATGAKYHTGETITDMTNGVITTSGGKTLTATSATAIVNRTALNITDKATLETAAASYDLMISAIGTDGGNATLIIVIGMDDSTVADGDVVQIASAQSATTEPGSVSVTLPGGGTHTVYYNSITMDDGISNIANGYYVVEKSSGNINLKFNGTYMLEDGDVLFIPATVTAGEVAEAYIVNSDTKAAGAVELVYIPEGTAKAAGSAGTSRGRFWLMQGTTLKNVYGGMYYAHNTQGDNTLPKNVFGFHDTIYALNGNSMTIIHAEGHVGNKSKCGHAFDNSCGTGTYGNLTASRSSECSSALTLAANYKVIDLRATVLAGTESAVTTAAQIKTLCDAGDAVINTYVPNGKTDDTATVIIVLDHTI